MEHLDLNVTIKAIEDGQLVLETISDSGIETTASERQIIRWPLSRIPRSLQIGENLAIRLEKNGNQPGTIIPLADTRINAVPTETAHRQRLLEELIN